MNKQILWLIAFLTMPIIAQATQVVFKGTIKNPGAREVQLVFLHNELTMENMIFKVNLNDNDQINISVDVTRTQVMKIRYEDKEFETFITPSSGSIEFQFNTEDIKKTLFFSGKNADDNNFLKTFHTYYLKSEADPKKYFDGYLTTFIEKDIATKADSYAMYDYFKYLESKEQEQRHYMNNDPLLSRAFRDFVRNEISWQNETNKLAYFLINKKRIPTEKLSYYWRKYALMQTVDLSEQGSLPYLRYQNMMTAFLHYLHLEAPDGNDKDDDLDYYTFIDKNLADRIRFFMQGRLMYNAFQQGQIDLAKRKFKAYQKFNPFKEYTETLEIVFGNQLEHTPSQHVPDFTFVDLNNQEKKLSDYRGKVVFVSLWASWCAPCLKGFQETHQVRQELERMGVVLLNVNVDKEENAWRRVLSSRTLEGTNVYAMSLGDFQKEMGFTGLPYYALVDKFGRLNYMTTDDLNTSKEDFFSLLAQ